MRGHAADVRDQIMEVPLGEGVLPVMHSEEPFALLDGLLSFGVVFDPGEVRMQVGGRNAEGRGVRSVPIQRHFMTVETGSVIHPLTHVGRAEPGLGPCPELVRIRANSAPMSIVVIIATLPSTGSSLNGTV